MKATRSVERALSVLEAFRRERKPLSLKTLSVLTELPKATLLRLLNTMESAGYIVADKNHNTYLISPIFLDLNNVVLENFDIRAIAMPVMKRLKELSGETINLYIVSGINRICIEQVNTDHIIRKYSKIGDIMPLYCGAAGKLLLAYSPESVVSRVIKETGLKAFTENTITEPEGLLKELKEIRRKGYSISNGEREENILSIAAPIFNYSKEIVAAITISGPSYRLIDRVNSLIEMLLDESKKVTNDF